MRLSPEQSSSRRLIKHLSSQLLTTVILDCPRYIHLPSRISPPGQPVKSLQTVAQGRVSNFPSRTTPRRPLPVIMDQRELDSRVKALQKAIAEREPATNVITIMETLKNNVNPTEELLRVCYITPPLRHCVVMEIQWVYQEDKELTYF